MTTRDRFPVGAGILIFTIASGQALGPTLPLIKWLPDTKLLKRKDDHSLPWRGASKGQPSVYILTLLSSSSSLSFPLVILLLNQWCTPPIRLQVSEGHVLQACRQQNGTNQTWPHSLKIDMAASWAPIYQTPANFIFPQKSISVRRQPKSSGLWNPTVHHRVHTSSPLEPKSNPTN